MLRAAIRAGVRRVVMTSAANAASPASYASDGITDETLWTVDDPSLPAYRRSKTLAEKAPWDFMAGHDGPTTRVPRAAEPAQHRQGEVLGWNPRPAADTVVGCLRSLIDPKLTPGD